MGTNEKKKKTKEIRSSWCLKYKRKKKALKTKSAFMREKREATQYKLGNFSLYMNL